MNADDQVMVLPLATVSYAVAALDDERAVARLLEPIPASDRDFVTLIKKNHISQIWDRETRRDLWIYCDGSTVVRITIAGVFLKDVARVRKLFRACPGATARFPNTAARLVQEVIGGTTVFP